MNKAPCPSADITSNIPSSHTIRQLWTQLQKLQNRAAHVLTFSNRDADAGHLPFELLGWISLACQRIFLKRAQDVSFFKKSLNMG